MPPESWPGRFAEHARWAARPRASDRRYFSISSAHLSLFSRSGNATLSAIVMLSKSGGLKPWEIWLSESQERMVLAVPPQSWPALQEVFAEEGVEATVIGRFTGDGRLSVRYDGAMVADLDCAFLHDGMPSRQLESVWSPRYVEPSPGLPAGIDLGELLERALADANVASKEPIVRQYDHEVQGRTVGKPFVGPQDIGPADAAVLRPVARSWRGLAVGCGINPWYGEIDPYAMALLAVDEALRNVVAVGADPARTAILDNFCWGNPHLPGSPRRSRAGRAGVPRRRGGLPRPIHLGQRLPLQRVPAGGRQLAADPRHAAHLRHRHRARYPTRDVDVSQTTRKSGLPRRPHR